MVSWAGEGLLIGCRLLSVSPHGGRANWFSGASFLRHLYYSCGFPSWPSHYMDASFPVTIPLDIKFSTCEFGVNTNIHTIVILFHICGMNTHVSQISHLKLVMCIMDNKQTFFQGISFLSYSFFCPVIPFLCLIFFLMATNFQRRHIIKKSILFVSKSESYLIILKNLEEKW